MTYLLRTAFANNYWQWTPCRMFGLDGILSNSFIR